NPQSDVTDMRHTLAVGLRMAGKLAWEHGDSKLAGEYYKESLDLFKAVDDKAGAARALSNLATLGLDQPTHEDAIRLYEESLVLARDAGDKLLMGGLLSNIGSAYRNWSRFDAAKRYYEESLVLLREINDRIILASPLNNLALLLMDMEDYEA